MSTDTDLRELVGDFVVESRENLEQFEHAVLALEQDPTSRDLSNAAFRALHTVKGTCAFFDFRQLEAMSHLGESVLARLRDGNAAFTPSVAAALLRLADVLKAILEGIEEAGTEPETDTDEIEEALDRCLVEPPAASAPRQRFGETLVAAGAVTPGDIAWAVAEQAGGDPRPIGAILLDAGLVDQTQIESVLTLQGRSGHETTVRVDVEALDELIQLVGELARTRDSLATLVPRDAISRLDRVAESLRSSVLRTRLERVDRSWSTLPRLVRDLAEADGKQVRLVSEGRDTTVDRTLLAAVKDPLTHLVRNAVRHGIESPRERQAAGKPAEATVTVRAHAGDHELVIDVADDGRGVDLDGVRRTALARGLLTPAEAVLLSPTQIADLVLRPGFSTAASVTNVSGRGVGLDVVRTDVERVGGRVEILSTERVGCTVRLHLPTAPGSPR